ncbi:MAG: PhoD-like phosphatase N-terminal domain-containing protein, partial [Gammaproteobacteria bacterium]
MHRRSFIKILGSFISILSFRINSETSNNKVSFNHGIASGDPTNTNVIIWTKLTVNTKSSINVNWEVALDKSFNNIINMGYVLALKSKDHTIKKDVYVDDKYNGLPLFYRFNVGQIYSPI